ncbi:MAG TPA: hypothetical protein VKB88_46750 [Bryobacteraceae bacterium]|nr:hypothetical protein [Bryobacteraceae bacterium]
MPRVIGFLNVLNDVAALVLARGEPFVSLFDKAQQARSPLSFSAFTITAC